jgi:hypothetical protein
MLTADQIKKIQELRDQAKAAQFNKQVTQSNMLQHINIFPKKRDNTVLLQFKY